MESIIVSVVTGACSIVGVVLASAAASRKLQQQLEISQAVMNTLRKTVLMIPKRGAYHFLVGLESVRDIKLLK